MRICRGVQNVLLTILAIMILAVCGLMIFGYRPSIVVSGSMEPTIPTGSLCFYNIKVQPDQIKKGDIIVFRAGDKMLVTHRAVEVSASGIKTKGDNNKSADPGIVLPDQLVGENAFWIPHVGTLLQTINTWPGRFLVLAICAALFCFNLLDRDQVKSEVRQRETSD